MKRHLSPEERAAIVRRMVDAKLGTVQATDWYPAGEEPYRYVMVSGSAVPFAEAPIIGAAWVALTTEVRGYLVMHTHYATDDGRPAVIFDLSVSWALEAGERLPPDEIPSHSVDVDVGAMLAGGAA